jgi:hypothetical protein
MPRPVNIAELMQVEFSTFTTEPELNQAVVRIPVNL